MANKKSFVSVRMILEWFVPRLPQLKIQKNGENWPKMLQNYAFWANKSRDSGLENSPKIPGFGIGISRDGHPTY